MKQEAALVGQLTAIDGMTVLRCDLSIVGFGGKVSVPDEFGSVLVESIRPIDKASTEVSLKKLCKGMRHYSAAMICKNGGRGTVALVVSQDGPLTIIMCTDVARLTVITPLDNFFTFLEY
jgi:hypothetical protein